MEQANSFEEFEQEIKKTNVKSWIGEIILTITLILLSMLSIMGIVGTSAITIIVAGILSSIYFYFSFAMFNNISLKNIFKKSSYKGIKSVRIIGAIAVGIQLSIIVLALLFKLMMWPGDKAMAVIGGIGLVIILLISLIKYTRNKSDFYFNILKRIVPYLIVVIGLIYTPRYAVLEYKNKGYNNYIEAVKAADENPENKALQQRVREEKDKMYEEESE